MTEPRRPPPDAAGIILAGGRASRFGSDKLVLEIDGRPLLHLAIEAVAAVAAGLVVVAAPGQSPALPAGLETRISVVHDPEPYGGPLVGLGVALGAIEAPTAVVVGGDMPSLRPAVLRRLIAAVGPARPAAVLEVPGRVQPLPMAIDVAAARIGAAAVLGRGRRSLRDLLAALGATSLPAPVWLALDPGAATIVDIDRPTDLGS